jgi:hypothetical protein
MIDGTPMTPVGSPEWCTWAVSKIELLEADRTEQKRLFPMQRGPAIPWSLAATIYAAYSKLYGTQQSLEKLAARGGFSWREVEVIFAELKKREPAAWGRLMANHPTPHFI